jgi:predicted ferric reductase
MVKFAPKILFLMGISPSLILTLSWAVTMLPDVREFGGWTAAVSSILAQNAVALSVILVILGSRVFPLERFLGLDRMMRLHKPLAGITLGILLAHVLLQFQRFTALGGFQLAVSALITNPVWEMTAGRLALVLLILAGVAAVLGIRFRLSFRIWKPVHLLAYAAVPLALAHALFRGTTMGHFPQVVVWGVLAGAYGVAAMLRLRQVLQGRGRAVCTTAQVVRESHDTASVYLRPPSNATTLMHRRPGQFALLRVQEGRGFSEPHPFTISGAPEETEIRFTIKQAGRFTRRVHALKPGSRVRCEGPYGVFCKGAETRSALALIAGGVGITPFLSLLRHFSGTGRSVPTVLVWANKTQRDIFARNELSRMTRNIPLRVVHVLSRENGSQDPAEDPKKVRLAEGRITAALLRRHLNPEQTFYLCGPPAMQSAVLQEIRQAFDIHPAQVFRELFFW